MKIIDLYYMTFNLQKVVIREGIERTTVYKGDMENVPKELKQCHVYWIEANKNELIISVELGE